MNRTGTLLIIVSACAGCLLQLSCRKEQPKYDTRTAILFKICTQIVNQNENPESVILLAQEVLDKRDNGVVDPVPILVHAGYTQSESFGFRLLLVVSDEDFDVIGFRVQETNRKDGSVLIEDYPRFALNPVGHFQALIFFPREDGVRMDHEAWRNYSEDERNKFRKRPPIFISIPDSENTNVEIFVYDRAGNVSNTMPLVEGSAKTKAAMKAGESMSRGTVSDEPANVE